MIELTFTQAAMKHAIWLAEARMATSDGCKRDRYAAKSLPQRVYDVQGALGETAFAMWSGAPWPTSVRGFHEKDFPPDIQIRSIGLFERGGAPPERKGLIYRKHECADDRFVLVWVVHNELNLPTGRALLRGWAHGREVQATGMAHPDGAWWLLKDLHPMATWVTAGQPVDITPHVDEVFKPWR